MGEVVLRIPSALLRSLDNSPADVVAKLGPGLSVHAILALSLCLDSSPGWGLWRVLMPTQAEVEASMPLCWPAHLRHLLPSAARSLLAKQLAKLERDWLPVTAAYPSLAKSTFVYAWALVNSRSFYHTTPFTETALPREDHMVLQPIADLFNHASDGCLVAFDRHAFTFTTAGPHLPGDELFIRYGAHSNDFLLVEYGFTMPASLNPWDEACLDPYLCPLFSSDRRSRLDEAGFWGNYMLDAQTACYRTRTALRLLCLPPNHWSAVLDGSREEDRDDEAVNEALVNILLRGEADMRAKISQLDAMTVEREETRASLRSRLLQVLQLFVATISRLER